MKRSLATLALAGLVAIPVSAQDPHVWSDMRADAVTPAGVRTGSMVAPSTLYLSLQYSRTKSEGLIIGTEDTDFDTALDFYDRVPFERSDETYTLTAGIGLGERFSFLATVPLVHRYRGQMDADAGFNYYRTIGLGDVMADLLVGLFDRDAVRVHAQIGVDAPTGSIDEEDVTLGEGEQRLPFDSQLGTGSWVVRPAITGQVQNEYGTVGAQIEGGVPLNINDSGWRYGNSVTAQMWASYALSDLIAVSTGVRYERNGDIVGQDSELDPAGDPGQDPLFNANSLIELPLGVNIMMPEGSVLEGSTLQLEFYFPVHQESDNFQLKRNSGLQIGFRTNVGG